MNNNKKNILEDLISLYKNLYLISQNETAVNIFSKDMLNKLKYSPDEIEEFLHMYYAGSEKQKTKISQEIAEIQTKEQVFEYFKQNLLQICQPDTTNEEKKIILKKVTLEEVRYLYKIIFGIPLEEKCKKIDAVYKIKNFFDNEERTADLVKNI